MIPYERFGTLRLIHFLANADVVALDYVILDKEWRLWGGEARGFSEWLRLDVEPDVLRSLAIDFTDFPQASAEDVLRTIELPVRRGMGIQELCGLLDEPTQTLRY